MVGQKVYRAGLFTHCKAIGWYVDAYKRAQLSINLTNYKVTPPHDVLEAARKHGGGARPGGDRQRDRRAWCPSRRCTRPGQLYLRSPGQVALRAGRPTCCENAVFSMGLADVAPFEIEKKVLGLPKT